MISDNIPMYMRNLRRWILYHFGGSNKSGKRKKIPDSACGKRAININDPTNWATFDEVFHAFQTGGFDGIGFVLEETDIVAIDVDHCINSKNCITDVARDLLARAEGTYAEISPSGTGIHIYYRGRLPSGRRRNDTVGVEMYGSGSPRYMTVTGDIIAGTSDIAYDQQAIDDIHRTFIASAQGNTKQQAVTGALASVSVPVPPVATPAEDEDIIRRACAAKNGAKFARLMRGDMSDYNGDHSRADLAFCCMLAYWTRGNKRQMDSIIRQSGLMRGKWDEARGAQTYGDRTLEAALAAYQADFSRSDLATPSLIHAGIGSTDDMCDDIVRRLYAISPCTNIEMIGTELGAAELFAKIFSSECRYVVDQESWYSFDGKKWICGLTPIMGRVQQLAVALNTYVRQQTYPSDEVRDTFCRSAKRWTRRVFRQHLIADAQSLCRTASDQFNPNPYLINLCNGTYDLRAFKLGPHRASDMITKIANVSYNPDAKSALWSTIIAQIFLDDDAKIDYFQRAVGYTLIGMRPEECLFLFSGGVRAGKGTIVSTLLNMLGDYSCTIAADSVSTKRNRNASGPSDDIARLSGVRLATINEPDRHLVIDNGLIKAFTGNDKITARYLYKATFEFVPKFLIWVVTNYTPTIDDPTVFQSGRIRLISFKRRFQEFEQDHTLKSKLVQANELEGIFNWCVEGLKKYYERGLTPPPEIRHEIDKLASESDILGTFCAEILAVDLDKDVKVMDIYRRYRSWCGDHGYFPDNYKIFLSELKNRYTIVDARPRGSGRTASAVKLIRGYALGSVDEDKST